MSETFSGIFVAMIDRAARYMDRSEIFRKLEISRNQFYNVTNPNRLTQKGERYHFPAKWGIRATNKLKNEDGDRDLAWIRAVCSDCEGMFISKEEIKELQGENPEKVLKGFLKLIERVKK